MPGNSHPSVAPVAIVGMSVIVPGAGSLEDYWHNLVNGVDAISDAPDARVGPDYYDPDSRRVDRVYCRRGGFVDDFAYFDPMRFGIMPSSVAEAEPDQLLALQVAGSAIDDAGGLERLPDPDRTGVILGRGGYSGVSQIKFASRVRTPNHFKKTMQELFPDVTEEGLERIRVKLDEAFGEHHPESVINLVPNLAASRIANRFNLRGPAYTVDGACASSLLAVDHAVAELASGRLDAVLAGGSHHIQDVSFWAIFSQLGGLSRRGEIRPFDESADGLLAGEASGVVVLKRLADALRDQDRIYAVIRGSGTSSDGRAASLVNPEQAGQAIAVRRAWASAGLDPAAPDALGMLEAHGTATPVGDAAEIATIADVFGSPTGDSRVVVGSVKSMIGHAMPAAGIAGLVKAALAVSRGSLLPTLHCENPRPELARTRFMPIADARPWDLPGPRRAAVNAFGFGGINGHVVIEEAPPLPRAKRRAAAPAPAAAQVTEPERMVLLTAPDAAAMAGLLDLPDDEIRARPAGSDGPAEAGAASAQCRLGIIEPTAARLSAARKVVAAGRPWRGPRDIWFSPRPLLAHGSGRVAFVFPGLEADFEPRLDDVAAHFGLDSRGFDADGDMAAHLDAVVRAECLMHEVLERVGVVPDALAGHSLGEMTAVMLGGLIDEPTLTDYMVAFEAAPEKERTDLAHAVIGDGAAAVTARLGAYPGVVLTIDNTPAQSVVCGPVGQVAQLLEDLSRENTLTRLLPFATGIHSPYMKSSVQAIQELSIGRVLPELQATRQVWSATIAAPVPAGAEQRRDLFFRQWLEPVRFRPTVQAMYGAGVRAFLQVGPGQLASLVHDNLREHDHLAMPVNVGFRSGLEQLRRVVTALWVEGYPVNLAALDPALEPEAEPVRPARPARPARSMPVRLELGWIPATLGDDGRSLLGLNAAQSSLAPDAARTLAQLSQLGPASSASAEFARLLEATASAAAAVISAASQRGNALPSSRPAAPVPQAGPPAPAPQPHVQAPAPAAVITTTMRLSLEAMPYVRDHSFIQQPADWPAEEDRFPVLPATTIMHHMIAAVQAAAPGVTVTALTGVRYRNWTMAAPPQDIQVTVQPDGQDRYAVTFGPHVQATIHTAAGYPAPPPAWRWDPATERPSYPAADVYAKRYQFHGPAFQGIDVVHAIGDMHVRGLLRTPAAPGALLDSALQLIGVWLHQARTSYNISFPQRFGAFRFYGPHPAAGELVECIGRITNADDDRRLIFEMQVADAGGGPVWAVLEDAVNLRVHKEPDTLAGERFPGTESVAVAQPEGWVLLYDGWPVASEQLRFAQQILGMSSFYEFHDQPIATRRPWLLGQAAVKDAARQVLLRDGRDEVFPVEIRVTDAGNGRAWVLDWPERNIPALEATFAQAGHVAVAMAWLARPGAGLGAPGPGIAVFEVSGAEIPLSDEERAVLAAAPGDRALWLTRFRAARRAVEVAQGADPGAPGSVIRVLEAGPDAITVVAAGRSYHVGHREIANPPRLAARRYVAAWTCGSQEAAAR